MLKAKILEWTADGGLGPSGRMTSDRPSPALPSIRNGGEGEIFEGTRTQGGSSPAERDRLPWAIVGRPAGALGEDMLARSARNARCGHRAYSGGRGAREPVAGNC